jgi:hypothetical protein
MSNVTITYQHQLKRSQVRKRKRELTDEDVIVLVEQRGELTFSRLPRLLQRELRLRKLSFGPREPSDYERHMAEADAAVHRRYTFTETLDDLCKLYNIRK